MKYLVRVKHRFENHQKGEELILSASEFLMWKKFVRLLKLIKESPDVIKKC